MSDHLSTPAPSGARVLATTTLGWVAGPDAGHALTLGPGIAVIGRSAAADLRSQDPDLAPFAALAEVAALGAWSVSVTRLAGRVTATMPPDRYAAAHRSTVEPGDVVALGSGAVVVGEPPGPEPEPLTVRSSHPGRVGLCRSPRVAVAGPVPVPPVPVEPPETRPPMTIGVGPVAVAGSTGLVLAAMTGRAMLALVGVVASVATLAVSVVQRAWTARASARRRRAWLADVAVAERLRAVARVAEERRRRLGEPGLVEAVRWATTGSANLWARRPGHIDAFTATIGLGSRPWSTVVGEDVGHLEDVPVPVWLGPGTVVGLVGVPDLTRAVARSLLVQLVSWHGPADLAVGVLPGGDHWSWVGHLPHAADPLGGRPLVGEDTPPDELLERLVLATADGPMALLVVDGDDALAQVGATLPPPGGAALVLATRREALPASCTTVVDLRDGCGRAILVDPAGVRAPVAVRACGLGLRRAGAAAGALGRFDDPELHRRAPLPSMVSLAGLLGTPCLDADELARRWLAAGEVPLSTPIGLGDQGVFEIDLERDGPHALVAGTTGSGKSELLRSLVAGLAVRCSPRELNFLLIDFKGGSAFDSCVELPHVVGVVTDLDGGLGRRVLRSLDAELRWREQRLRAAGAADHLAYRARLEARRAGPPGPGTGDLDDPMPRLVVVIDELAALAAELPDFLPALVGMAQRGRSLGLHLVLATQRPAGVVSDDLRANTSLRIALRVIDRHDAIDIVGDPMPALLGRDQPGRALVRRGPGGVELVQAGLVSGTASGTGSLAQLVATARAAAEQLGLDHPRRPWLDPLPTELSLDDMTPGDAALADDPDRQAQHGFSWDRSRGHLLVTGAAGTGTSTTLLATALAMASSCSPEAAHLYAFDGDGALASLVDLPHTGAVVASNERRRQVRLLRWLAAEVDRRRGGSAAAPELVVLLDGLDGFRAAFDDVAGLEVLDDLGRVLADGASVGVHVAASVRRPGAVPASLMAGFTERWVLRLAEPSEAAMVGVPAAAVAGCSPGRAAVVGRAMPSVAPIGAGALGGAAAGVVTDGSSRGATGSSDRSGWFVAQIGRPSAGSVERIAGRWTAIGARRPHPIGVLPVRVAEVRPPTIGPRGELHLPVGVADDDLGPAELVLRDGDQVLVAGPAGSGRTSVLLVLAEQFRRVDPGITIAAVCAGRSPLSAVSDVTIDVTGPRPPAEFDLAALPRPLVVIVDDAERLDGPPHGSTVSVAGGSVAGGASLLGPSLAALAASPGVRLIVAGRVDALRGTYGHWTQAVRRSRVGLLLEPGGDDGDLLGVVLPRRRWTTWVAGRAELVQGGRCSLVQVAQPVGSERSPAVDATRIPS